jgi:hypothetical protein
LNDNPWKSTENALTFNTLLNYCTLLITLNTSDNLNMIINCSKSNSVPRQSLKPTNFNYNTIITEKEVLHCHWKLYLVNCTCIQWKLCQNVISLLHICEKMKQWPELGNIHMYVLNYKEIYEDSWHLLGTLQDDQSSYNLLPNKIHGLFSSNTDLIQWKLAAVWYTIATGGYALPIS